MDKNFQPINTSIINPLSIKETLAGNPIGEPQFAKKVKMKSGEEVHFADPRASRAMIALMDMGAVQGGAACHYGGPAAFAELMSAAYGVAFHYSKKAKVNWFDMFHIINDAGHCENGIYALHANYKRAGINLDSLKKFRSIESSLTGHGEALLFSQGVYLSNGPLGSSVAQAQGLACADKLAGKNRLTISVVSDGACMEGEVREALASIPGFAAKGKLTPFIMVISDNNTKLSGRIDEQSFSMIPTFDTLKTLGWDVIFVKEGNDLNSCVAAFEEAIEKANRNANVPVVIWAKTIKGIGTKKTMESSSGSHGFPLKTASDLKNFIEEIYAGSPIPSEFLKWQDELIAFEINRKKAESSNAPKVVKEKVQAGISRAMITKRKEGIPIVSISSDVPGSTGVETFRKEFPNCAFDVGIAESNMISLAVGMSKAGFIPVVDTFAQFGVTKGALPLMMASLSEAPIIAVFSHAGFQDAADGASHQALSYLAMTHAIPNVETYILTSSEEAERLMELAIGRMIELRKQGQTPPSVVFFLGREDFQKSFVNDVVFYELGRAQVVFDNTDALVKAPKVTLVAAGPLLPQALKAAQILADRNVGTIVINPSSINHPDIDSIYLSLEKTNGYLVTVEDHQITGGMASVLIHGLVERGVSLKAKTLGVRGKFGRSAYQANELYVKHGLDTHGICQAVIALIGA